MALPRSLVLARPPMSGVRGAPLWGASTFSMVARIASCAFLWPRNSSIMAPHQICPIGFAMPLPAMSGAEPCTGTIGIAPSANLNPERTTPSLFEPVHGSAPDIAGKGIANPIGQIWCGAMMLEFLGHKDAHDAILAAIEKVLAPQSGAPRTRDIGGNAGTVDLGSAIAEAL